MPEFAAGRPQGAHTYPRNAAAPAPPHSAPGTAALLRSCRLKDVNAKCPDQLKAYYECMDFYR